MIGSDFHFKLDRPSGVGVVPRVLLTRADVVLSVNWHFGVSFWTSATMRFRRTPHVGVPIFHIDRPWAQREDYSRMLQRCDAVIALTESEASFVRARGGGSVSVGGGGIDPARFSNANGASIRSKYGLGARSVVGFVGRQDEDKGVPTLIRAMVQVWQQAPETVLLLAGPSAHRSPVVTDLLRSLPESSRGLVVLVDDFSDQEGPAILSACEVVAQPSVEEAFGLALIEAWICGRPVIGADIAATRCLIDHGVDGWIVKPLDPLDLAERILDLLGNRDRRESFGTKGREKVLARYTWDRIIDSWEATCRDVLKGRSG
jgi:glycosyltransferase involved in cell wall biosynthesis